MVHLMPVFICVISLTDTVIVRSNTHKGKDCVCRELERRGERTGGPAKGLQLCCQTEPKRHVTNMNGSLYHFKKILSLTHTHTHTHTYTRTQTPIKVTTTANPLL